MQPSIAGLPDDEALPALEVSNFVATWEVSDPETFEVDITMHRTTGAFGMGDTSKVDLFFGLPSDGAGLDDLVFEPSDIDIELPIPKEESDVEPLRG